VDHLRIGICGTFHTGKTSLAENIAKNLELPLIGSQTQIVAKRMEINYPWYAIQDRCLAREFMVAVLLAQIDFETRLHNFVTDQTLVDYAAAWLYFALGEDVDGIVYHNACLASQYDLLIYTPLKESDTFCGIKQQMQFDRILKAILFNLDTPILTCSESKESTIKTIGKLRKRKG
jgi:hypothetical protein